MLSSIKTVDYFLCDQISLTMPSNSENWNIVLARQSSVQNLNSKSSRTSIPRQPFSALNNSFKHQFIAFVYNLFVNRDIIIGCMLVMCLIEIEIRSHFSHSNYS